MKFIYEIEEEEEDSKFYQLVRKTKLFRAGMQALIV